MRIMQPLIRIQTIRDAAAALGVSLFALCREAGVSYPSVRRWLREDHQPGLLDYAQTCEKLEAAIERRTVRARSALQRHAAVQS